MYEVYVDDCRENWDILNNLEDVIKSFIYLKDSRVRKDGKAGVKVSEISSFQLEENDEED